MAIKQKAKNGVSRPQGRSAYSSPKLRVFGPVGALTQAGTIGMSEMGPPGGTGSMQMDNMQRT